MNKLYKVGLRILIALALSIPSKGNAFPKVETGGREDSAPLPGNNKIQSVTISENGAGCTKEDIISEGPCSPPPVVCAGDITLTTQAEVDAFPATYGCSEIKTARLLISGNDITNLDSLYSLTRIEQLMIRNNASLSNLDGLSNLSSVGKGCRNCALPGCEDCLNEGFYIETNPVLSDISGLSSLARVDGNLIINSNPKLINLDGLNRLTSIGGWLGIMNNASLTNLDGLSALDTAGLDRYGSLSISISNNRALTSIKGLRSITSLPGYLGIGGNTSLPNLDGLDSLVQLIGVAGGPGDGSAGLVIQGNASLTNIDALSALSFIRARGSSATSGVLRISDNPSLANLNGLASLTEISGNGELTINNNDLLTNVDGLSSLVKLSGFYLSLTITNNSLLTQVDGLSSLSPIGPRFYMKVADNPKLTRCCGLYQSIVVFRPDGTIIISGNGGGCTKEEILAGGPCDARPEVCYKNITLTTQAQVDAFPATYGCSEIAGTLTISGNDITNLDSLHSLTTVGHLSIRDNGSLTNLDGLSGLSSVGETVGAEFYTSVYIWNNAILSDIGGLSSLQRIN